MEAPPTAAYRGYARSKARRLNSLRRHGYIYYLVSPLYLNEANKPGYGQRYILDSAEATTKRLENQRNEACAAEVMQRSDEMLRHLLSHVNEYIKLSYIYEQ
jgi:hypothetical protein